MSLEEGSTQDLAAFERLQEARAAKPRNPRSRVVPDGGRSFRGKYVHSILSMPTLSRRLASLTDSSE